MRQKRQKQPKSARPRIYLLDELRGFAILCMVVHHAFLDVGDVLQLSWGYRVFDALCTVQPIFWGLFILISGICSRLSRNPGRRGAGLRFGDHWGYRLGVALNGHDRCEDLLWYSFLPGLLHDLHRSAAAGDKEDFAAFGHACLRFAVLFDLWGQ